MKIDIIAEDASGRDVLLVAVMARPLDDHMAGEYVEYLRSSGLAARFAMVADSAMIRVVDLERWDGAHFDCVLDSAEVLSVYEPEFRNKKIYHFYMTGLVDAWLSDVDGNWKSQSPPGSDKLEVLGLAEALKGGVTRREVMIETNPIP